MERIFLEHDDTVKRIYTSKQKKSMLIYQIIHIPVLINNCFSPVNTDAYISSYEEKSFCHRCDSFTPVIAIVVFVRSKPVIIYQGATQHIAYIKNQYGIRFTDLREVIKL